MNIKNLERAKEIAEQLPVLEKARHNLSTDNESRIQVTTDGEPITLPASVKMNVVNILNMEINHLKDEAKNL